jgi:hypothetical protein
MEDEEQSVVAEFDILSELSPGKPEENNEYVY